MTWKDLRKWTSKVERCEPYWDKGWMIPTTGRLTYDHGTIVKWREPRCPRKLKKKLKGRR